MFSFLLPLLHLKQSYIVFESQHGDIISSIPRSESQQRILPPWFYVNKIIALREPLYFGALIQPTSKAASLIQGGNQPVATATIVCKRAHTKNSTQSQITANGLTLYSVYSYEKCFGNVSDVVCIQKILKVVLQPISAILFRDFILTDVPSSSI